MDRSELYKLQEALKDLQARVDKMMKELEQAEKQDTPRAGLPWSDFEDQELEQNIVRAIENIAWMHGRTFSAIASRLDRVGLLDAFALSKTAMKHQQGTFREGIKKYFRDPYNDR